MIKHSQRERELMKATPSFGPITKAAVARASAAIVDGATTVTLALWLGERPETESTM
jgi:hypothetical protein